MPWPLPLLGRYITQNLEIRVELTEENAGHFYDTGKHTLLEVLGALLPGATVKKFDIKGTRLWLSTVVAIGGVDDHVVEVKLPQRMNVVEELNIHLSESDGMHNDIDGNELSILLGALPNLQKLTISCGAIHNCTWTKRSNVFNLQMAKVSLPQLTSCDITTTYGESEREESAKVDESIKKCLLESAPQLHEDALKIQKVRLTSEWVMCKPTV
jgi:hypothetical protein